jgi:MFS family permease
MRRHRANANELPLRSVLRTHKGAIALGMLSTWMLTAAIVVVILISPSLLQNVLHVSPSTALQGNLAGCAALCLSVVVVGVATDRFGIRRVSIVMSALLIFGTYALFVGAARAPSSLVGLYIIAGFGAGAAVLTPIALVAAFPPSFRFTGVSVSYNLAYSLFGGVTPLFVTWLIHGSPLGAAHYVAIATIIGLASILIGLGSPSRDAENSPRAAYTFASSKLDDNID